MSEHAGNGYDVVQSELARLDRRIDSEIRLVSVRIGQVEKDQITLEGADGFGKVSGKMDRMLDGVGQHRREINAKLDDALAKFESLKSTLMAVRMEQAELLEQVAKSNAADIERRKADKVSLGRISSQNSEILKLLRERA